jgi:hypothetical protein
VLGTRFLTTVITNALKFSLGKEYWTSPRNQNHGDKILVYIHAKKQFAKIPCQMLTYTIKNKDGATEDTYIVCKDMVDAFNSLLLVSMQTDQTVSSWSISEVKHASDPQWLDNSSI